MLPDFLGYAVTLGNLACVKIVPIAVGTINLVAVAFPSRGLIGGEGHAGGFAHGAAAKMTGSLSAKTLGKSPMTSANTSRRAKSRLWIFTIV